MAEPFIKQDPDSFLSVGASPSGFTDDDIYEDAGDLEFGTDPRYQQIFFARLPQYIWDKWEQLDDDAEIRIGTIRRQIEKDAKGNDKVFLGSTALPYS
jgi:transcription initiation factor TFIIF subunit beta